MAGSIYDRMMGTPQYDSSAGTSAMNAAANAFQGMASTFNTMRQSIIDEEQKNLQREMEKQHHKEEMDYKDRSLAQDYKQHTERLDFERLKHADDMSMEQKKLDMQWKLANLRSSGGGGGGRRSGGGGSGSGGIAAGGQGMSLITAGARSGGKPILNLNPNQTPSKESANTDKSSSDSSISFTPKTATDAALEDAFQSLGGSDKSFKLDSPLDTKSRASRLEGNEVNHGQPLSLFPTIKRTETPKEDTSKPLDLRAYSRSGVGQSILRSQLGTAPEDSFKASVNPYYQETNRSPAAVPSFDMSKAQVDMPQEWRNDDSVSSLGVAAAKEGIDINPAVDRNAPFSVSYEVEGPLSLSAIKQTVPQANAVNAISTMYENPSVDYGTPRANQLIQAAADRANLSNRNFALHNAAAIQEDRDEQTRKDWFKPMFEQSLSEFSWTTPDFDKDYAAFAKKSTEDKIDTLLDYKLKNDSVYQDALKRSSVGVGPNASNRINPNILKARDDMLARREELRKEAETEIDTYFGEKKTAEPTRNSEEERKVTDEMRAMGPEYYEGPNVMPEGNDAVALEYSAGAINDEQRSNYTGRNDIRMNADQAVHLYNMSSDINGDIYRIVQENSKQEGSVKQGTYREIIKSKDFAIGLADHVSNVWARLPEQERRNVFDKLIGCSLVAQMTKNRDDWKIYNAAALALAQTFSPAFNAKDSDYRRRLRADMGEALGYGSYFYDDRTKAQENIDKKIAVKNRSIGLLTPGNIGEEDIKKLTHNKFDNFDPIIQERVVSAFNDDGIFKIPRDYVANHKNSKGKIDSRSRQVAASAHAKALGKVIAQYYNESYLGRGKATENRGFQQFMRDLQDPTTKVGEAYQENFNEIVRRLEMGRKQ